MGIKGDKMKNESVINAELLVKKLGILGDITSKRMFGGNGIFYNGKMFGMVDSKGLSYFKVDTRLQKEFAAHGYEPHAKMPYTSIPQHIFMDDDHLRNWAEQSIGYMLLKTKK